MFLTRIVSRGPNRPCCTRGARSAATVVIHREDESGETSIVAEYQPGHRREIHHGQIAVNDTVYDTSAYTIENTYHREFLLHAPPEVIRQARGTSEIIYYVNGEPIHIYGFPPSTTLRDFNGIISPIINFPMAGVHAILCWVYPVPELLHWIAGSFAVWSICCGLIGTGCFISKYVADARIKKASAK